MSAETLCQASHSIKAETVGDEAASLFGVIYGNASEDFGEEVRFAVELTQVLHPSLDKTTYSLDVRRLKGNLRSYTFLLYTLRE